VCEETLNGLKVFIKRVRVNPEADPQKAKEVRFEVSATTFPVLQCQRTPQTFSQLAILWKHSSYPGIVPLLSARINPPLLLFWISAKWASHENVALATVESNFFVGGETLFR